MKRHMTTAEGKAFREKWAAVNTAELQELRATTIEWKAKQLIALMSSVGQLGWNEALAGEESEVRQRWNQLRKVYLASKKTSRTSA